MSRLVGGNEGVPGIAATDKTKDVRYEPCRTDVAGSAYPADRLEVDPVGQAGKQKVEIRG
jgi:hypothetical protein